MKRCFVFFVFGTQLFFYQNNFVLSATRTITLATRSSLTQPHHRIQETKKQAKQQLKEAFSNGRDLLISLTDKKPSAKLFAFDWDGVITEEKGYYENAWAALIDMMAHSKEELPFKLSDEAIATATAFRKQTRGHEYGKRFASLRKKYNASDKKFSDKRCIELFWESVFIQANKEFSNNLNKWVYPLSEKFLKETRNLRGNFPLIVVSANVQESIECLAKQLQIGALFTEIHGHPLLSSEESPRDKTVILKELERKYELKENELIFFGDAPSDIEFGKKAKVITVGIANNYENGLKLIETGADFVLTRLTPTNEILMKFGVTKSTRSSNQSNLEEFSI